MSLQKRNEILRAHVIIVTFWYFVLFFWSDASFTSFPGYISKATILTVGGVFIGAVTGWSYYKFRVERRREYLTPHSNRGLVCSLGEPPSALLPPVATGTEGFSRFHQLIRFLLRKKKASSSPLEDASWFGAYKARHPQHAAAMEAIMDYMMRVPDLPASPVPGGHGGATLIKHSMSTVETMIRMTPSWSYKGHKDAKGEISFPLLDSTIAEHKFKPDDPLPILTAFAHDIGKMVCYRLNETGTVTEVRKNHDIEGAKVLRGIQEVMALPWKDSMALLIACEYYHHIGSLPRSSWIDDRARSLIELLIAADVATGKMEGGAHEDYEQDATPDEEPLPVIPAAPGHEGLSVSGDDEDTGPVYSEEEKGSPQDILYSILRDPGRVNGTSRDDRVAWKHGEWLYINEAKMRSVISSTLEDPSYAKLPHRGNMHPFTLALMAQLASKGFLFQDFDGKHYSEKRAIFNTTSAVAGNTPVENKFILVVNVKAFPGLENAADCKSPPVILACSWGEGAAINKKATGAAQDIQQQDSNDTGPIKDTQEEDNPFADESSPFADSGSDSDITQSNDESEATYKQKATPDLLKEAAESLTVPYVKRVIDGDNLMLFELDLVQDMFSDFTFDEEDGEFQFITGGSSQKKFIGVKIE